MKKIFTIFVLVLTIFSLYGCNQINSKDDDLKNENNQNPIPFEVMNSNTYVTNDTYNYENVYKHSDLFKIEEFAVLNNLDTEDDYLVIDNYIDWLELSKEILNIEIDPLPIEEGNKFFENSVRLIIVRRAPASNYIEVIYQFDSNNHKLMKSYPHFNENGDTAIFDCLDIVEMSRANYNSMINRINIDYIPFEVINDGGLYEFYGSFDVLINTVEGFPFVVTVEDEQTSQRIAKVHERYNEEYFKTYSLGIVNFNTCSSEKNLELKEIKFENNKIVTIFDIASNEENTDDLIIKNFIFQIRKEDIKALKLASYDIDIKVNNTLDSSRGSYNYDKYEKNLEDNKSYNLILNDSNNVLIDKLNDTYKAKEKVVVKTKILADSRIEAYLDNRFIGVKTNTSNDEGYWEFDFIMPTCDATLFLIVSEDLGNYDKFVEIYISADLLSTQVQSEIVYRYLHNNGRNPSEDEKGFIDKFYGSYNNTFVVMMASTMFYHTEVLGQETIDGVTFFYGNSNRIRAYKNGIFYSLQTAFDKGLLNHDDLMKVSMFNKQKFSLTEILGFPLTEITNGWYSPGMLAVVYKFSPDIIEKMVDTVDTEYVSLKTDKALVYQANRYFLQNEDAGITISLMWTKDDYIVITKGDEKFISFEKTKWTFGHIEDDNISITVDLAYEIKLAYALKYSQSPKPIPISEINSILIRFYHGCYNGCHIVMLDGYFAYTQAIRYEIIGGVKIQYSDGNGLLAYNNGVFYTLKDAYNNNFLEKEDLEKISKLHKTSKAFAITIIGEAKE